MGDRHSPEVEQAAKRALEDALDIIWYPQDGGQHAFMSCPFFEVLAEGNRGGGKTDTLIMDFCQDVGKSYGGDWTGILFRQTYPQLQDVISKSKKWIPQIWPGAKFNEAKSFWRWPTGEVLYFRQFNKPDDYWNYHGHAYPWVGWEELCNWSMDAGYKRMFSCVRSSNPEVARKARVRATTNPYGPGHNWVKHRFRLPAWRNRPILDAVDENGLKEPSRVAVKVSLDDNKKLLESDPEYKGRLIAAARNEAEKKAWMEGDWDIVAGGMFDDVWKKPVHVVRPFPIPTGWRIDRSFDWGSSRPFSVGWWATSDGSDIQLVDPKGRPYYKSTVRGDLFRIGEWYGWSGRPNEGLKMLAKDIAAGIVERQVRWGIQDRVFPGPADTSIFDVENGNSIATDMEQPVRLNDGTRYPGVFWTRADKTSRKNGWEQVRQWLKNAKPSETGAREFPGMFVFSTCDQFLRVFPVTPRDDKDLDDVDTDSEDHLQDEVRYRVRAAGKGARSGRRHGGA